MNRFALGFLMCANAASAQTTLEPPSRPGALAPSLVSVEDGVILSWLEPPEDGDGFRFRAARVDADGTFGTPVTIAGADREFFANWADVPAVALADDGTLYAHWLQKSSGGTYSYDVMLARSDDDGRSWRHLGPAHFDGTPTEHGFVSMARAGGAPMRLVWLDGRAMSGETGDAHDDHGHGGGNMTLRTALLDETVRESVVLDPRVCECCPTTAVRTGGSVLVAYRDRGLDELRDVSLLRYDGREWSPPTPLHDDGWRIAGCPVNGPSADARDAVVALAWFTQIRGDEVKIKFSPDEGATFGAPIVVDDDWNMGAVDVVLLDEHEAIVTWLDGAQDTGWITARRVRDDGTTHPPVRIAPAQLGRGTGIPRAARIGDRLVIVWTDAERPSRVVGRILDLEDLDGD